MANGQQDPSAILQGAPWPIKLFVWLLAWFGFPILVTLIMFGIFTGYIPSPVTDMNRQLTRIQTDLEQHQKDMAGLVLYSQSSTRLLRVICRNTSKTDWGRDDCDSRWSLGGHEP